VTSSLRLNIACALGNTAGSLSRYLNRGRGETLSGRVILAIHPNAIKELTKNRDVVLISGTNGKTTSTSNLAGILSKFAGEGVSTSRSGANMPAGIVAALAQKPRHRLAAIECDEMYLPSMYRAISPSVVVLLNLSRDQLHRTGEVRKIAQLWQETFTKDDVTLVIDRDDPFVEYAASRAGHVIRVSFGGRRHSDGATCPQCSKILDWSTGNYACSCGLGSKLADVRSDKNLSGPERNTVLITEAARLMGAEVSAVDAQELLDNSPDRVSQFDVDGRMISTHLAKNPESWREALAAVSAQQVILSINARGIDGRDTSWLWDIDFAPLKGKKVVCTGERRLDIAYRTKVQGCDVVVAADIAQALTYFPTGVVQAIASYTAFQDLAARELGITKVQGDQK
jgi:UDP-N-acetylmuramyl tripeptide synthase